LFSTKSPISIPVILVLLQSRITLQDLSKFLYNPRLDSHIKLYFPGGSLGNNISLIEVEVNISTEEFKAQMNKLPQQLSQYAFLTTL